MRRMKLIARLTSLFALLAAPALAAPKAKELTTAQTFTDAKGGTLNYRIYVPPNLDPSTKIPLVLFLHGAGERGNDNTKQVVHGVGDLIAYSQNNEPAIVVAPQCPNGKKWVEVDWKAKQHASPDQPSESLALVFGLLKELEGKHPIDKDRLYVTGLSMGGYGTWDVIQRQPQRWAAAIPICGGGDARMRTVKPIKSMPIWVFHGDADKAVPVSRSRDMMASLKQAKAIAKYTEYPDVGHNSWTPTYRNTEVLKWLFAQRRK